MNEPKLKPCPFCGGKDMIIADTIFYRGENSKEAFSVRHPNQLECCISMIGLDKPTLIESWNKRTTARKVNTDKMHLFEDSEFFEIDKFKQCFNGTPYEDADLDLYHEKVLLWSKSSGAKKIDWIATARNFMLRDSQDKKLVLKNGAKQIDNKYATKLRSVLDDLLRK